MKNYEIEIKLYINSKFILIKKLCKLDCIYNGSHFETNVIYENKLNSFLKKKILLRVRKTNKETTLTFKEKIKKETTFKISKELKIEISSFTTMNKILENLGYHKKLRYEKWREFWAIDNTILSIDTMPYGTFLEIEGEPKKIKNIVKLLNLKWKEKITKNYIELFQLINKNKQFNFKDISFKNFENKKINLKNKILIL